jgi:hypothetical protein
MNWGRTPHEGGPVRLPHIPGSDLRIKVVEMAGTIARWEMARLSRRLPARAPVQASQADGHERIGCQMRESQRRKDRDIPKVLDYVSG